MVLDYGGPLSQKGLRATDSYTITLCLSLSDDNVSAGSGMEMDDRISHLEQRVQLQEDEIQLLKAALADALRRLGCCEEITQSSSKKGGPTKGHDHFRFCHSIINR
uniref:Uncharacterized protein n=1 Tax=Sinocyclocheilus rhinocerous TaxID=307959 RepID=A0A673HIZ1_9TELE